MKEGRKEDEGRGEEGGRKEEKTNLVVGSPSKKPPPAHPNQLPLL
jgi:hypothetical protein